MPRFRRHVMVCPGRRAVDTRTVHVSGDRGHFSSMFGTNASDDHDEMLRRLFNMYEYGHGTDTRRQPKPLNQQGSAAPKPDPVDKDVLGVEKVDFLVAENVQAHHTDEYDITDPAELPQGVTEPLLVVRRGQPFKMEITFNRAYDKSKDELKLVFQAGSNPMPSKGTHVEMILSDRDEPKQWGAKISGQRGNALTLTIFTPPDCYVATWKFKVDVLKKKDEKKSIFRYNHKDEIYILFNPWCKDDAVYLEGEQEKQEYVLNENGRIYSGSARDITHKPWNFGQFQGNVLRCCMMLLEESNLSMTARGNPIQMVRNITCMVNSPDDYGVLEGNWSGNYAGGTSPLSWTGSVAILEQYFDTKEPVKYGQCWVFSGVTTTVCRALGIPARSVTNFASAHDTDGSISIDVHFEANGEANERLNNDSVWNFHVWNESWMARRDLPTGFGGWQAMDATPQETSDGIYCCGPVPVLAIKRGEVHLPYDGTFVFAEVNGDKVYWQSQWDGQTKQVHVDAKSVGKHISTKCILKGDREDVTGRYKFPEGSEEERIAVYKANQVGSSKPGLYQDGGSVNDVKFEMDHTENVFVGGEFFVILRITNTSKEPRKVHGSLACKTMYYTGIPKTLIKRDHFEESIGPGETKEVKLRVMGSDYEGRLLDMCMMQLSSMATVDKTGQVFTNLSDFRLKKPHLEIKAPTAGQVGKKLTAQVSFCNPLNETLTNCTLKIDGPGLQKPLKLGAGQVPNNVGPKSTFSTTVEFTPRKKGERDIVLLFSSDQLDDINGSHTIIVKPK